MNNYTILIRESRFFLGSFPFTWEQRKLGEEVQITMGQSPDGSSYTDIPSDYILVQGNADIKNGWVMPRVWTSQVTKKAEAGDLIMSVRAPAGEMGKTAYNAVIGRGVAAIKGNEFIFQSLVKMNFEGYWKRLSCGSTFESLNSDNIKNAEIMIPHLIEQLLIGSFFENLDNLITLHQRKYEYLYNTCLGEILSLLLKFTPTWEQRKLGELSDSFEYGLNAAATEYDGENKYIRITDIDDVSRRFVETDLTSPQIDLSNAGNYKLKIGDILFARTGASVGKSYIYNESDGLVYYAGFLIRTRIKPEYDAEFVFQSTLTSKYNDYIRINSQRSGQPGVNAQEYAEFSLLIPEPDEQFKIGTFFRNLDTLITLHQREPQIKLGGYVDA